jgi:hypothetical protein
MTANRCVLEPSFCSSIQPSAICALSILTPLMLCPFSCILLPGGQVHSIVADNEMDKVKVKH